jgi:hypothetical protein
LPRRSFFNNGCRTRLRIGTITSAMIVSRHEMSKRNAMVETTSAAAWSDCVTICVRTSRVSNVSFRTREMIWPDLVRVKYVSGSRARCL